MLILVGCEESQTIVRALRAKGHEVYSCDLKPTRGNPEWHIQGDIMKVIPTRYWDLIILHPDCTALSLSGNRWYGKGKPYHQKRLEAIDWTIKLWQTARDYSDKVALENPTSVIFRYLSGARVQYIQPWQFGHGEVKKTGFALWRLPLLKPTNVVEGREQYVWKMGADPLRKRDRSITFTGVAEAIAEQWASGGKADARDLKSLDPGRAGSNPASPTKGL